VPLKVSVSGIRGIIGDGLDAQTITAWATAFGKWLPAGSVIVGRDTRPSGPMVLNAVTAALVSTGHDVIDIGLASTPTTEMAVQQSDAIGGVIITASHNPQQWNALKLLTSEGLFLTASEVAQMQEMYNTGGHVAWDKIGSQSTRQGSDEAHIEALLDLPWLDKEAIASCNLTAAVDAVEGAGGRIVPMLLESLGVKCLPLYCDMTGNFPHTPEPTPANLVELGELVAGSDADIGFAVDPDVDRLVLVEGSGKLLSEEMTLAVAVDFLLGKQLGNVVVNLSTTGLIEEVAGKHNSTVKRSPVGEINVVEVMQECDAVIGGEGNGGVIYPLLHSGRDALVGIAMVLQYIADSKQTLTEIVANYPPVVMVKEKFDFTGEFDVEAVANALSKLGPGSLDKSDGVRWSDDSCWVHVRPSNTEPVVRVIAEAESKEKVSLLVSKTQDYLKG
jgi:phosphomannomutase